MKYWIFTWIDKQNQTHTLASIVPLSLTMVDQMTLWLARDMQAVVIMACPVNALEGSLPARSDVCITH